MMDEHSLQIMDEAYKLLLWAALMGEQLRHGRMLKAKAVKQWSEQTNGHGICVHSCKLH